MPSFILDPTLKNDTVFITSLKLCDALLMNNRFFPWVILVPRANHLKEITDLNKQDQHQLMVEMAHTSNSLQSITQADKMNVGALGNVVAQLHVHIIARFTDDPAWPAPVWGQASEPYPSSEAAAFVSRLREILASSANNG